MKRLARVLVIAMVCLHMPLFSAKIGLLVAATGKYIQFAHSLLESADRHFFKNHEVHYFVYTDGHLPAKSNTHVIFQQKLGWPYDTLMRFEMYLKSKDLLKGMDYVFACDADMLIVNPVGDEILSQRVGTLHPGYLYHRGPYENRQSSTAYVAPHEGKHYFAGAFYGGITSEFIRLCDTVLNLIKADFSRGLIAQWHDESHLNRYFINNIPTKILGLEYCYPSDWQGASQQKILALVKNHALWRLMERGKFIDFPLDEYNEYLYE